MSEFYESQEEPQTQSEESENNVEVSIDIPKPEAVQNQSSDVVSDESTESDKEIEQFDAHKARILVVGAGGAGNNCISRLSDKGVSGAMTLAINTDAKHLKVTNADKRILVGKDLTRGLGAGGYPEVGRNAAKESKADLKRELENVDLVFLTCGLGGGTGTGALPVIAKLAKEAGAIVIAAVTLPFKIEGARIVKAEEGLAELRATCDTAIVIENQKLLKFAGDMPLKKAFGVADELISTMIKGITETISEPSLVNLDYADVKAVMQSGGVAAIGVGESEDDNRAEAAIMKALNHPLLEVDYKGATGALIQIIGGEDMTLEEINTIGETVSSQLDPEAQVIWGARISPEMEGKIHVITIITGVKSPYILGPMAKREPGAVSESVASELGIEVIE
ncbi:cell division protein FtsZ [archaeon]|nr:cell division protein FtsZ [archaeon]|tara:strand:+ start:955 stop:2136 length:1182 start_codon:yes stop_codon:yes gene_type:complete